MTYKPPFPRSVVLAIFAAIAVSGTGYLLGSPAAEGDMFAYHTHLAVPAYLPEDDWTGGPRECDVALGITTSCIFPD